MVVRCWDLRLWKILIMLLSLVSKMVFCLLVFRVWILLMGSVFWCLVWFGSLCVRILLLFWRVWCSGWVSVRLLIWRWFGGLMIWWVRVVVKGLFDCLRILLLGWVCFCWMCWMVWRVVMLIMILLCLGGMMRRCILMLSLVLVLWERWGWWFGWCLRIFVRFVVVWWWCLLVCVLVFDEYDEEVNVVKL